MRWRFVFLAAAAAVLACERSGKPREQAAPAAQGPDRASGRPEGAPRGDRHARAAARRSLPVKRVDGTLASVGDRQVVIRRRGAPDLPLRVSPRTRVTLNGRPATFDGLREGADVRAAYQSGDGGRPTALSIEASSKRGDAAPPAGGEKPPQSASERAPESKG
jgi:hypothetical protein